MSLFAGGPLNWLVSSALSWSFPNQEAIRARIGESRADSHGDLARFDGVVLGALQETETALSAYRNAVIRKQSLVLARDAAARAAVASEARQRVGRIDFLAVLDAQRTLAGAEADLADSTRGVAMAQVDLFRALGGGWQQPGSQAGA
jgi:outer membrane protein TolC